MNCQDFEPFLFAYVDGEFDGPEKADADAHLAGCDRCRREVELQRTYKRRLRALAGGAAAAPEALRSRLLAAIAREPPRRANVFWLRRRSVALTLAAAASIAAVVVWQLGGEGDDETLKLTAEAIEHHRRGLPLDVQDADNANVRGFLQARVDFAPRIPQLRNATLLGARVSTVHGRPAALVAYGTPGSRRVSLLVFGAPSLRLQRARQIADREVMLANQRGYNVALWKDGEIAYSLVSDLDESDVLELVQPLPRQHAQMAFPSFGGGSGAAVPTTATCAHPVCAVGSRLAAGCDPCVRRVCAHDSFCCDNAWDATCLEHVAALCDQPC